MPLLKAQTMTSYSVFPCAAATGAARSQLQRRCASPTAAAQSGTPSGPGWNGGGPVADSGRRLPASCPGKSGVTRFAKSVRAVRSTAALDAEATPDAGDLRI
jgi:hypothetical protein